MRTMAYADLVKRVLKTKGLDDSAVKVHQIDPFDYSDSNGDNSLLEKYSLSSCCSNAYCPGCNFFGDQKEGEQYIPALIIDDSVVLHSCFPNEEKMKQTINSALPGTVKR